MKNNLIALVFLCLFWQKNKGMDDEEWLVLTNQIQGITYTKTEKSESYTVVLGKAGTIIATFYEGSKAGEPMQVHLYRSNCTTENYIPLSKNLAYKIRALYQEKQKK